MLSPENDVDDRQPASDTSSTLRQDDGNLDVEAAEEKIQAQELTTSGTIMEKILSRTRSRSSYIDPGPPPDGGLTAWAQALCGHLLVANTWGYISSFGSVKFPHRFFEKGY